MKDINEVLRKKEYELAQIQRDVEALRVAARILSDEGDATYTARPAPAAPAATAYPQRAAQPPQATAAADAGYGSSWDAASKKFP